MYLHNHRKRVSKNTPHAKHEQLLFALYGGGWGDHQRADSDKPVKVCCLWWTGSSLRVGADGNRGGGGYLSVMYDSFSCLHPQNRKWNHYQCWFSKVRAHAFNVLVSVWLYFEKKWKSVYVCEHEQSRASGNGENMFLMCSVAAYLPARDVRR